MAVHRALIGLNPLNVIGLCRVNPNLMLSGSSTEPTFGQVERPVDDAGLNVDSSGAIFGRGATRFGLRTSVVGLVGDNPCGQSTMDKLAWAEVTTDGIVVSSSWSTGHTVVLNRVGDFPGQAASPPTPSGAPTSGGWAALTRSSDGPTFAIQLGRGPHTHGLLDVEPAAEAFGQIAHEVVDQAKCRGRVCADRWGTSVLCQRADRAGPELVHPVHRLHRDQAVSLEGKE